MDSTKEQKAKNKMTLTISSLIYSLIEKASSTTELWEILSDTFADNGHSRIVS